MGVEAFQVGRVGEQPVDCLGVVQQGRGEYAGGEHELVAHVGEEGDERLPGDEVDCLLCDEPDEADGVREALGGWAAQRMRERESGLTLCIPGAASEDGLFLDGDGAEETVEEGEPGGAAVFRGRRVEDEQVFGVGKDGGEEGVCTGPVPGAVRGAEGERCVEVADRVHRGGVISNN